jgi:hypothetical protein
MVFFHDFRLHGLFAVGVYFYDLWLQRCTQSWCLFMTSGYMGPLGVYFYDFWLRSPGLSWCLFMISGYMGPFGVFF